MTQAADDEAALREKAREKMERGDLPRQPELRLWAGNGVGHPCSLCERPITPAEMEYELQFERAGALLPYRFHRRCHAAWQLERERA